MVTVIAELIKRNNSDSDFHFKPKSINAMTEVLKEIDALGRKSSGDNLAQKLDDYPDVDVTPKWTKCQLWGAEAIQELLN